MGEATQPSPFRTLLPRNVFRPSTSSVRMVELPEQVGATVVNIEVVFNVGLEDGNGVGPGTQPGQQQWQQQQQAVIIRQCISKNETGRVISAAMVLMIRVSILGSQALAANQPLSAP